MDLHTEMSTSQQQQVTPLSPNCTSDYVRVRDGDDSDAPVVGTYCLNRVPAPITSQGSALYLHMEGRSGLGVGFRATYSLLSQCNFKFFLFQSISIF